MGPGAQAAAARCATARAELKMVGMLTYEGSHLPVAEAADQGVEILFSDDSEVQLGLFTIPAIDGAITVGPKGESCTRDGGSSLLLHDTVLSSLLTTSCLPSMLYCRDWPRQLQKAIYAVPAPGCGPRVPASTQRCQARQA